jgi:phosphoribosylamine--glycine ligase
VNVLVIGSGAREHALSWKLKQSPFVSKLFVAPGNAGTAQIASNLDIASNDIQRLAEAAASMKIGLTVVGPEGPLADGIVDVFRQHHLPIVGPTKAAACIESSKAFARGLMKAKGIPCPRGAVFESLPEACAYVEKQPLPIVVKADGLAAGKGVVVARTKIEALQALRDLMETRVFGDAGDRVVIEECLTGREVSLIAFTDGTTVVPMVPACDHKRVFDNDQGPNTGGMGSYSPPRFFDSSMVREIARTILEPAVKGMAESGMPYSGILYAGLMMTDEGPKVLEFNARFGDPETQALLPRLKTDLLDILLSIARGQLDRIDIQWQAEACVAVVMASGGYPGNFQKGFPIIGLDKTDPDVMVFHAATRTTSDRGIVTDGGRVLTISAMGRTIGDARSRAYSNVQRVSFSGCHVRSDIALTEVS